MIETQPHVKSSSLFQEMESMEHEQLVFCQDKETGLKAIIAIHNTVLGPGMGGTRMWNYTSEEDAIKDALRLSRGMTYKSAIAGLNIGGGKAVIIGDARTQKNEMLMRRFGRFVDSLGGRYWTAEDVNMSSRDMEYIRMETRYVTGIPEGMGGSGDPSPITAHGVYVGMKAAAKKVYSSDSLEGKKVLVQGAGNVGTYLVEKLVKENATVLVSDIFEDKIEKLVARHKVEVVNPDSIFDQPMDIYAPCALGATLNDASIAKLKCAIVAGGANNQLEDEKVHGKMLKDQGILYAPDFLINSGGITNVYYEMVGNHNLERVYKQTDLIYDILTGVIERSEKENITTHESALQLAKARIESVGKIKLPY